MHNEKFWSFVKQMITKHQSSLKPCKFYAENKTLVENEYKKFITTTRFYPIDGKHPPWFTCHRDRQVPLDGRNPLDRQDRQDRQDR